MVDSGNLNMCWNFPQLIIATTIQINPTENILQTIEM